MKSTNLSLFLLTLLTFCSCQAPRYPSQSTPLEPTPTSTPTQTAAEVSSFTLELAKGPKKPVEIWLEGPTTEKRTVEPSDLSQTFELAEGVYNLTVRTEGFRNFALKIQIPENDRVKAVMSPLPQGGATDAPLDDPFER